MVKEVEGKLYTISLFYLGAKNEHHFKDIFACQRDEVFSYVRALEHFFMHTQGHQRVGESLSSNNKIHNSTTAVYGVKHQRPVKSKSGKSNKWFSQEIKEILHH